MRYYTIVITNPSGGLVLTQSSVPGSGATYTSALGPTKTIPGALQVEFDIPVTAYATPIGAAFVRIWGISLAEISASTQLNPRYSNGTASYFNIKVYGGMRKGLPLANPSQSGLLVQGSIQQAFGNWIDTDMTLDLIIAPSFGTNAQPANLSFDWQKNTPMSAAIKTTLANAFPTYGDPVMMISPNLVRNDDQKGFYSTLGQFASYVKDMSKSIVGGNYGGVDISFNNGKLLASDQTTSLPFKKIEFKDLIGQPTWIDGPTIQFKCPIRADISIGAFITMPPAIVTTTSSPSTALVNLNSAFKGQFYVNQIRHVGNFRQADAESWCTTINASPVTQVAA